MSISTAIGVLYAVAQVLMPCFPPKPLSSEVLSTDRYLGTWYYVGVASWDNEDIESYKSVDNSVVELKKGKDNTLVMAGVLEQEGNCVNMAWTYHVDPDMDPILTEGQENLGVFLDGNWMKCPNCMIIVKLHPSKGFLRIMLFARDKDTSSDLVKKFEKKLECFHVIDKFVIAPRTKDFCKLEVTE
ncbi:hypothetical protein [Paraclostridium dentum]|uniref:hypothetical protein n=1 Tax=Paraclostridium dentum TaxID=2662455 RepID=UPI00147480B8|nr:hypothetical protein [Paraclostridium dentum]